MIDAVFAQYRPRETSEGVFPYQFAFQPIVHAHERTVHGYEALLRGPRGEGASWAFSRVGEGDKYRFDHVCRAQAIERARELDLPARLFVNFLADAVYQSEACISRTIEMCACRGYDLSALVFELSEAECTDAGHPLLPLLDSYRNKGVQIALDDFGTGYAGLAMLTRLQPSYVKLSIELVRDIDSSPVKQAVVRGCVHICRDIGSHIVAEGVETEDECRFLADAGVDFLQGYWLGRPEILSKEPCPRAQGFAPGLVDPGRGCALIARDVGAR